MTTNRISWAFVPLNLNKILDGIPTAFESHEEYKKNGLVINSGVIADRLNSLEEFIPSNYLSGRIENDPLCSVGKYLAATLPKNEEIDPLSFVILIKEAVKVLQQGGKGSYEDEFIYSSLLSQPDLWCHNKVIQKISIIAQAICEKDFAKYVAKCCAKSSGLNVTL